MMQLMWFDGNGSGLRWAEAAEHLSRADRVLHKVIARVGPCQMKPRRDYFVALCRAIFAQQLNVRVAQVLFDRFRGLLPARRLTPEAVVEILKDPDSIRGCGLSRQKANYLRDLALHFADGRIPTRKLARMSDEQVIEALVGVKGIGRWTAEMFLMFVLNRPDVLPVDDLGLREGMRDLYGLKERPKAEEVIAMAEHWRPYRTVGTWYVWRRNTTPLVPLTDSPRTAARPRTGAATRRLLKSARRKS
jgi:DNA-3-methyladenine glycosylase II